MELGHDIQPGSISVKDTNVLRGLMERNFAPMLVNIIVAVADKFGVLITESYRDKRHSNDLHGTLPVRALDLRFWCYETEQMAYEIMHWINSNWTYDPARPKKVVAMIHDSGKGIHFHIQVSDSTVRRNMF